MKKILVFFLFLVLCFIPKQVLAFEVVNPTSNFYVNDYANILSSETENYIMKQSVSLDSETKAQIVVVTVPDLDGASLEEYATTLFRKFGIGDKEKNNGLLLLLALEEREMRVEVGYGLEGILPDGKTGRFQDNYMIPYFKDDNFDEGMLNGYKAFFQEIANYYNYNGTIEDPIESNEKTDIVIDIFYIILFILAASGQLGIFGSIIYALISGKRVDSSYHSGRSHRSSSFSSRSSSRGFSGRGGRSGGGGSSRGF